MSAGPFTISRYLADDASVRPIRIQPETLSATLGAANAAPAGAVTVNQFAAARKNRRAYGMGARAVRVRFTAAVPSGYGTNQVLSIPILTPTVYNGISVGTTGTYLGSAVIVVGKTSESSR